MKPFFNTSLWITCPGFPDSVILLAAIADLMGALSRGTGILLAVMIIYQFYERIAKEHAMDMHPSLRKMMGGEE